MRMEGEPPLFICPLEPWMWGIRQSGDPFSERERNWFCLQLPRDFENKASFQASQRVGRSGRDPLPRGTPETPKIQLKRFKGI